MGRILIVDDDQDVRRVLRRMFERAGHSVIEAESSHDALATVDGPDAPDAIVCDVIMPESSGLAFYQELVVRAPQLKHSVVFLTGASGEPEVHQPIEQLGVPLLGKLGDLQLVVDAIRIALIRKGRSAG